MILTHATDARRAAWPHAGRAAAIGLALLAAGCSTATYPRVSQAPQPAAAAALPVPPNTPIAQAADERQMIRRGGVKVSVDSVDVARRRVERAAASLGAQVAHLDANEASHAEILFRVPPDNLESLMDSAAAVGKTEDRTIGAEDVTDAIVDAEGRLASLTASRDRLRQLLDKAGSVPDVITVERELARVQGDIESLQRRIAALRGQVAMSELTVTIDRRIVLGPVSEFFVGVGKLIGKLFVLR